MNNETISIQENDLGIGLPSLPGRVIYVDRDATGNNDGSSWENAYTDLQAALEVAGATNEVWVAGGTYLPTSDGDRQQSFMIGDGAKVFGGFAGGETERSQRDFLNNRVILSGDIGTQGDRTDNSYHVVTIEDTNQPTVLDGFTIVDGQANFNSDISNLNTFDNGGGIYSANNTDVNLSNLIIANNLARGGGGGFYQLNSDSNLTNIAFLNNIERDFSSIDSDSGGAIYSISSTGTVINSLFANNKANRGSAVQIIGDRFDIINSTFVGNEADTGTINVSNDTSVNIQNSIFEVNPTTDSNTIAGTQESITVNNSIIQGGFDGAGENIIDADPLFVDFNNNNYTLQAGSPGIDAGNNAAIEGINSDLVGNARISNNIVDLGAYEFVFTEEDLNDPSLPEGDPVYRFFIPNTGAHFYTADEAERDEIIETQPNYVLEGTPYNSAPANDSLTGVAPVYRFLNVDTGVRIYTIDEIEKESIETNLPNYQSEGIAYYGYTEQIEGTTPVYRFYNPEIDAHFYTSSTVERDNVIENLPNYQLENNGGIAFYVDPILNSGTPTPEPLPDPITDSEASRTFRTILNSLVNNL